jgi:dTDP-4-amino-4,6-dideoxygalactose transaminase
MKTIPLLEPYLGGNEARYLQECVESNFVSSVGPFVTRFEEEFASYVGCRYAVACSTGTAAIHVALIVAGVEPGDEVMASNFTFIATVNPIVYVGARPILVDPNEETWNMDPQLVIDELDRRSRSGRQMPKALILAHVLGLPADIEPIAGACDRHGVILIEDAAEALGASYAGGRYAGKQVGAIGRLGCFSFNGNKIVTAGGGGMIVTDDEPLANRARHLTTQARLPGLEYIHDEVGYNYRLTNIQAAVGLAQLEQLPPFLARKERIAGVYRDRLSDLTGVTHLPRPDWSNPSWWLYSVSVDETALGEPGKKLIPLLIERGIQARPLWMPIHRMKLYERVLCLHNGVGDHLFQNGVSIPSSIGLDDERLQRVVSAVRDVLGQPTGL